MDAPAADLDAGTDLEEFEPDLAESGRGQTDATSSVNSQRPVIVDEILRELAEIGIGTSGVI